MTGVGKIASKKKRGKIALVFLCFICLSFAAGYHTGRATSTNWNSEQTAFLYACRGSHRIKDARDGTLLELSLPDAVYRYDGNEVKETPNAPAMANERYPVLSGQEYEIWLNGIVAFGAGAAGKAAWDTVIDSSEGKALQRVLAEERMLLSIVTVGSFGGGYLAGHHFQPSFDGPEFRKALRDKTEWARVWSYKTQLAQSKHKLDVAMKNLRAVRDSQVSEQNEKTLKMEKEIQKEYVALFKMDPDLVNIGEQP